MMSKFRVGVVGAGAAGLCALRHLLTNPDWEVKIWEQTNQIGGTWFYTDNIGHDEYGTQLHTSMYKNLKTNLPKEIMNYLDFPFPKCGESFIGHEEVLQYLQSYARHFKLMEHVKFHHQVISIEPVLQSNQNNKQKWKVLVRDMATSEETDHEMDAIFICNGHYFETRFMHIPNMDKFCGVVLHSHAYRYPEDYTGLSVVLVGGGNSAKDIAIELTETAKEVFICYKHSKSLASNLPRNLIEKQLIVEVNENGCIFSDGTRCTADVIMYCTGYNYSFPFLHKDCEISVTENHVKPLYKHMIHTRYTTMFFIGIPFNVVPFPLFDTQVQFAINILRGKVKLPSQSEMDRETERDWLELGNKGWGIRHAHKLADTQWEYHRTLAGMGNLALLSPVIEKLYNAVHVTRETDVLQYRKDIFEVISENSFVKL